jgi:hypothetical protein
VDEDLSLDMPSMLVSIWEDPVTASGSRPRYAPRFSQGHRDRSGRILMPLRVERGVLEYPVPAEQGKEDAADAQ